MEYRISIVKFGALVMNEADSQASVIHNKTYPEVAMPGLSVVFHLNIIFKEYLYLSSTLTFCNFYAFLSRSLP